MKRFDTSQYRASHLADPRGEGCWAFLPNTRAAKAALAAGDYTQVVWQRGTYTQAKAALPAGEWVVLP